jgi:hypothetical protein
MALKQEHALLIGLATAGAVVGIFQISVPTVASVRASGPNNKHLSSTRKWATITSVSLVTLLGLLTGDPAVFVIGGATTVALDASHRVANVTDNQSGQIAGSPAQAAAQAPPASS